MWVSASELAEDYRPAAARLGLSEQVRVWTVTQGLPAEAAGLLAGDLVLNAGGKPLHDGKDLSSALVDAQETGVIQLRIRSAGGPDERDVLLQGKSACAYPITVSEQDSINAMADGDKIVVTKGMMRFVTNDDELALVIGHEISHNALHHMRQNKAMVGVGAGVGLLLDVAAALGGVNTGEAFTRLGMQAGSGMNRVFSVDLEQDADYMAIYLSERAGFNIEAAPDFWRRMAAEQPEDIEDYMGRTHPSSPERSAALQTAIAEIASKKQNGLPLVPERE
jgi:Zn-dependent protease with chaperone function